MKECIQETDKGLVFYWQSDTWDCSRDTLFFLHGLTADHTMFDGQIKAFENDYNLLTWDTPAHGKSRPFQAFDFGDTSEYIKRIDIWILKQVEWMAHLYPLNWMKKAMAKQVSTTRESYDNMMQMLSPYSKNELCHLMGLGYAGFLDDNCELVIPCPVLLILGEKDKTGKVVQYNKAWTQKTGYPLKIINGAAHNANVDKPQAVNTCIRDFMSETNL